MNSEQTPINIQPETLQPEQNKVASPVRNSREEFVSIEDSNQAISNDVVQRSLISNGMNFLKQKNYFYSKIIVGVLIVTLVVVGGYLFKTGKLKKFNPVKQDPYVVFIGEVYDTIKTNYWEKLTDEQLTNVFVLAQEKAAGSVLSEPKPKDLKSFQSVFKDAILKLDSPEKKEEFSAQISDLVLANLQPFGRSRLYSQKQETDLKNKVENRNPDVDQYQILGVDKAASTDEIVKTYTQKTEELKNDQSPEAAQKLAQLNQAYKTLSDAEARKNYDASGIEPTMESRLITPEVFYVKMSVFSPTMVEELLRLTTRVDKGDQLHALILDLRGNIGGLIDGLPYFLGPFIGPDQYAYQFFHQGEKKDFKTVVGWLPSMIRYKKVVILIDQNSQSSAEVMAATLKRYNVGVTVGTTTKGWGTVEKVFELKNQISEKNKFSAFLVHSLTLRDDGLPIQDKGVDPVVNIKDEDWEQQLYRYYSYQPLIDAVKQVLSEK